MVFIIFNYSLVFKYLAIICFTLKRINRIGLYFLHAEIAIIKKRLQIIVSTDTISFYLSCILSSLQSHVITIFLFSEQSRSYSDFPSDPTLPRTNKRPCPKCRHPEAVFFQTHDRRRDTPMTLNFVCCNPACNHVWNESPK